MMLKLAKGVAWRRIGSQVVILRTDSGDYYSLADAGADLWECLLAGMEPKVLASFMAKAHSLAPAKAARDVAALSSQLKKAALVRESPAEKRPTAIKPPRAELFKKYPYSKIQLTRHSRLKPNAYAYATY